MFKSTVYTQCFLNRNKLNTISETKIFLIGYLQTQKGTVNDVCITMKLGFKNLSKIGLHKTIQLYDLVKT